MSRANQKYYIANRPGWLQALASPEPVKIIYNLERAAFHSLTAKFRHAILYPACGLKMMTSNFQCSADLSNLAAVRGFVYDNAQQVCADEDFLYDLILAVDEVVTNVIVHGYRGAPGKIYIEVRPQSGALAVVIKDDAPLFDPRCAPEPDLTLPLEQRKPGGLGIVFVRTLMDDMIYSPGLAQGNQLTLVKRCPSNGSQAGAH